MTDYNYSSHLLKNLAPPNNGGFWFKKKYKILIFFVNKLFTNTSG
jgi:hypothetical protein